MLRKGSAMLVTLIAAAAILAAASWWLYSKRASLPRESAPQAEGCMLLPYKGITPFDQTGASSADEDVRGGMQCIFTVNSGLPAFTFHFVGREDNALGNIVVSKDGVAAQTISNTTNHYATLRSAEETIEMVDANFDGYKDLQIVKDCGASDNCMYDFYLYDPAAGRFVRNSFLSDDIPSASVDEPNKQIHTRWHSSAYDWGMDTYQYQDHQYILIKETQSVSAFDGTTGTVTVKAYELRNGKMELTSSVTTLR